MRTTQKHDVKDLRSITDYEEQHLILSGHLRSFHAYAPTEDEPLTKLKRLHAEAHAKDERGSR